MPRKSLKPLRLLDSVPSKMYNRKIVRYPFQTNRDYAYAYRVAAQRLADTFAGNPSDDVILLPFLTLYRHGFELELKNLIRFLVTMRVRYVDGSSPGLEHAHSDERFKELGHNLHQLLNEVKKHYRALEVDEPFPSDVDKVILMLHEADNDGTAFRYAGQLPDTQEHADFPDLAALLARQYDTLIAVTDYVDGIYSAAPTLAELASDYY